jgi:hypothetical protein
MSRFACHLDALVAASKLRKVTPTNQPVQLTDEDCQDIDMAVHNWKASGGPDRDHDERALAIQMGTLRRRS